MKGSVVPFGKYKGQPAELLLADREYCEWLVAQPWFAERFRDVYNIVINYGSEPQDSPEHNALQARFLDDAFCLAAAKAVAPDWFDVKGEMEKDSWERETRDRCTDVREAPIGIRQKVFEDSGWDVSFGLIGGITILGRSLSWHYGPHGRRVLVECKPSVGDDYPSVLRQMTGYRKDERDRPGLVVGRLDPAGVTRDQVKAIFASRGIAVAEVGEVEDLR